MEPGEFGLGCPRVDSFLSVLGWADFSTTHVAILIMHYTAVQGGHVFFV